MLQGVGGQHLPVDVPPDVACPADIVPPAFQYLFSSGMEWSRNRLSINSAVTIVDIDIDIAIQISIDIDIAIYGGVSGAIFPPAI